MTRFMLTPMALALALLLGACSSTPQTTSLLDQTHSDFAAAQRSSAVARYAALEMAQASQAMSLADAAATAKDGQEQIDKLAYLARQKIALTQELAKQRSAEAQVSDAGKVRSELLLDQRTQEANNAKNSADQAKLAAQAAQDAAAQAQRRTQAAQDEATMSQLKMQTAQDQAVLAQTQTQNAQARAAQLEAQLADLAARKTERGMVITLGDVLFGSDLARLTDSGVRSTQKLATLLQQNPQRTVLIEGFTDSTGSAAHNQDLSERRADAVQRSLQQMGVSAERVRTRGYGESLPVAANDTAANRQLNRRVEIVLSDDSGKVVPR